MDKKYKLKSEGSLFRIIALRDIPRHNVKVGDKGGRVSGEHTLSQEGDCWIGHGAHVYDDAYVCDDALVRDSAVICNDAFVNNAVVCDDAIVCDCARIWGFNQITTKVGGKAIIGGMIHLNGGTWNTTPKVIKGSEYDVVYNAKQIAIGCECHPLEWWEEHGLWVAEEDNFTPVMVEEYRGHLNAIRKEYADE